MNICWMCKKAITDNYDINKTSQGLVICNTCLSEWKRVELIRLSHKKGNRRYRKKR